MWFWSVKKGALNILKGGGDIKSELHDLDRMPNYVEIVRLKCQKKLRQTKIPNDNIKFRTKCQQII